MTENQSTTPIRAFIDANVLSKIISVDPLQSRLLASLRATNLELVTYIKCVYELYSIIKGITKSGERKRHPLQKLLPAGINDISQRLFRPLDDIDVQANSYYWYALCEEWQGWDYFDDMERIIDQFVKPEDHEEARKHLAVQREWVSWKQAINQAISEIDVRLERARITVLDHTTVFNAQDSGLLQEWNPRTLARETLLPNEDFDLVLAAIWMKARVYVTEDRDLMVRGGASLGLNGPSLTFCHPSKLSEAAADEFACRYYLAQSDSAT